MKKALLIIGGIIVLAVGALVSFALYFIGKQETELNRKRTEPARTAKLEKKLIADNGHADRVEELQNLEQLNTSSDDKKHE